MPTTQVPEFNSMALCRGGVVCNTHPDFKGWKLGIHDTELVCKGYTAFAYDAAITLALVLDRLLKNKGGTPDQLTNDDWMAEMKELQKPENAFNCLSGEVSFNA